MAAPRQAYRGADVARLLPGARAPGPAAVRRGQRALGGRRGIEIQPVDRALHLDRGVRVGLGQGHGRAEVIPHGEGRFAGCKLSCSQFCFLILLLFYLQIGSGMTGGSTSGTERKTHFRPTITLEKG